MLHDAWRACLGGWELWTAIDTCERPTRFVSDCVLYEAEFRLPAQEKLESYYNPEAVIQRSGQVFPGIVYLNLLCASLDALRCCL